MEELNEYQYKIKEYILPDEELLWIGRPTKEIKLLPAEKFNRIFGIFWTAFSVFWMSIAIFGASMAPDGFSMIKIFPLFGVPFLLIGLYLVIVAPIRAKNKRKNTEYALTNKRILILYSGKTIMLQAFKYTEIQNVNFASDAQGVGCVTFMNNAVEISNAVNGTRVHRGYYGLYNIANIKKVYKIFAEQIGEEQ